ncbi:hypothetical protein SUNI508_08920 [Seiridium unicorne]|uniref:NAD(P)-binding protein n=1 Tax=Seiridium unicorne TaxID=138068 RepID=A0ABR2URR1_9PEZI
MFSPVILILGAGPNIGQHVAKTFAAGGYKVAAARSVKEAESTDSQLNIPSDFIKSDDVVNAFSEVKKVFGIPSVFVYNGRHRLQTAACQCGADVYHDKQYSEYGDHPELHFAGHGKSAGAHMMWAAADAYKSKGYKSCYADERKANGTAKYMVEGHAHAKLFKGLAEEKMQGPWHQTFVMGKGYQMFASSL